MAIGLSPELKQKIKEKVKAEVRAELAAKYAEELRGLRRHTKRLRKEIAKIETYAYGSYTQGRPDWQARWERSRGKRILLFAPVDASGSFYKWAEAINRHTEYAARLVTLYRHKHGYALDLLLPFPDLDNRSGIDSICEEADIFHIKDEPGFYSGTNLLPADLFTKWSKPQIFTAHGGYMRKLQGEAAFRDFVGRYDARVAMTPDLNYDWFRGKYIPHTIDTDTFSFGWTDSRIVAHSPTRSEDPEKKGTHFFRDAITALENDPLWHGWAVDLITGVSYSECMDRKRRAALFFDQAGEHTETAFGVQQVIGWYGNSAIEAMAFGIPTIAHMSEEAFAGAERAGHDIRKSCPVINIERSSESLKEVLREFAALKFVTRHQLATRTREWAVDFHGYERVGRELAALYRELLT